MVTLTWVINIALVLCAIALIVVVLMQETKSSGMGGALGGGNDNFFGKNANKTKEARLGLMTKILAGLIGVLSVAMVVIS